MCTVTTDIMQHVERRVLDYRSHICRVIRAPSVLRWMPDFISQAEVIEIQSVDSRIPERASFMLIEALLKCTELGKWKAFTEALGHADYYYLKSLLTSKDQHPEEYHYQMKMLQIFAPYLGLQLEPCDIIYHLCATDVLNGEDVEEIQACQRTQGSVAATMLMLDRMQRRQAPSKWYIDFLKILYQKGYTEIVKEMEPEFTIDSEILKIPSIIVTDSNILSREGHDHILENMIETNVMYFKLEITNYVCVKKMAPALCHLLNIDEVCQLMQNRQLSQKESSKSMLESIEKLQNKTKWRSFISCLIESDYPHLAALLSRSRSRGVQSKERELLKLFLPALGNQLDPALLVSYLEKENAINTLDKEEIMSTLRQSGKVAASLVLLTCMQCRLAPHLWFSAFLKALLNCGRKDIVLTVDPDYFKTSRSLPEVLNDRSMEGCEADQLSVRLDKAHCYVYNLEKSAKHEMEKIEQHFDVMLRKLKEEIETKTTTMAKSLEYVDDMMKRLHSNNISGIDVDDVRQNIKESLDLVMVNKYALRRSEDFMKVKNLGVLGPLNQMRFCSLSSRPLRLSRHLSGDGGAVNNDITTKPSNIMLS